MGSSKSRRTPNSSSWQVSGGTGSSPTPLAPGRWRRSPSRTRLGWQVSGRSDLIAIRRLGWKIGTLGWIREFRRTLVGRRS